MRSDPRALLTPGRFAGGKLQIRDLRFEIRHLRFEIREVGTACESLFAAMAGDENVSQTIGFVSQSGLSAGGGRGRLVFGFQRAWAEASRRMVKVGARSLRRCCHAGEHAGCSAEGG